MRQRRKKEGPSEKRYPRILHYYVDDVDAAQINQRLEALRLCIDAQKLKLGDVSGAVLSVALGDDATIRKIKAAIKSRV
jgi:hypothetical protein